jgi:FMN phosphatase YigB (HAD superfamily)
MRRNGCVLTSQHWTSCLEFDAIVSSVETGLPKPDPGAFAAAEAAASAALGESVVGSSIDDTAAYVQAAEDRDWRALRFVDGPAL